MLRERVHELDVAVGASERFVTVCATADRLQVSPATLSAFVTRQAIRCFRVSNGIRIRLDEPEAYRSSP